MNLYIKEKQKIMAEYCRNDVPIDEQNDIIMLKKRVYKNYFSERAVGKQINLYYY